MSGGPTGATLLVLTIVVAVGGLAVVVFNRLIRDRERTREAWSAVDVQIKRRAALIPNLAETVRGYAAHEHDLFEALARARGALEAAGDPTAASAANAAAARTLRRALVVAEAYPELRAVDGFTRLQDELSDVEEKIAYARHFYNRNVERFNARIQQVPYVLVAALMGLVRFPFFTADDDGDPATDLVALGDRGGSIARKPVS